MFNKVLIANRGEIAIRVMRTAHRLGIPVVAVYSTADRDAPHVKMADEAICIGDPPAAESYLRIDKIVSAAQKTGADAVHPGYGFLSENANFCETLEREGIAFIGPTSATINAMGSKSAAKDLMENAGVPTLPGYQGADQSVQTFLAQAEKVGYPVLLKATAGGGGKGMRLVEHPDELEPALESARREAKSSFGDDRFLLEKFLVRPRHIEVQIFGDGNGNVVHVFERDCSVQRRHQKVLEEAPAPDLPATVRKTLLDAGVRAGEAVNYRGAGTVEFLYDGKNVFFMEMNTRLQVEHPVSEEISGLDFVEWQLHIAAGQGLPLSQSEIRERGHAFEARLYAEDTDNNFAPSVGRITQLVLPTAARNDCGVEAGQEITPYYDPMISKIITHAESREKALAGMRNALAQVRVVGLETNARFLHALCSEPDFINEKLSTAFIEEHSEALFAQPELGVVPLIALALAEQAQTVPLSIWSEMRAWRLNAPSQMHQFFRFADQTHRLSLSMDGDVVNGEWESEAGANHRRENSRAGELHGFAISQVSIDKGTVSFTYDNHQHVAYVGRTETGARIWFGANFVDIEVIDIGASNAAKEGGAGSLLAHMPGIITGLKKSPGDTVEPGETLLTLEAMKMEPRSRHRLPGSSRDIASKSASKSRKAIFCSTSNRTRASCHMIPNRARSQQ